MQLRLFGPDGGRRGTGPFRRLMSWSAGWAVRRAWPDGTHELSGFSRYHSAVQRRLRRDAAYWHRGPVRPTGYEVVATSLFDFRLHPPRCDGATCPRAIAEVAR